jgi:hypothetical protein
MSLHGQLNMTQLTGSPWLSHPRAPSPTSPVRGSSPSRRGNSPTNIRTRPASSMDYRTLPSPSTKRNVTSEYCDPPSPDSPSRRRAATAQGATFFSDLFASPVKTEPKTEPGEFKGEYSSEMRQEAEARPATSIPTLLKTSRSGFLLSPRMKADLRSPYKFLLKREWTHTMDGKEPVIRKPIRPDVGPRSVLLLLTQTLAVIILFLFSLNFLRLIELDSSLKLLALFLFKQRPENILKTSRRSVRPAISS